MGENKNVSFAMLGAIAIIAIVGLVLLFNGAIGKATMVYPKIYPGKVLAGHTGPGFPAAGGGSYATQQQGSCDDDEMFLTESKYADPIYCRPGAQRIEIYTRDFKFFWAEDQRVVVDGYCCKFPEARAPTGE